MQILATADGTGNGPSNSTGVETRYRFSAERASSEEAGKVRLEYQPTSSSSWFRVYGSELNATGSTHVTIPEKANVRAVAEKATWDGWLDPEPQDFNEPAIGDETVASQEADPTVAATLLERQTAILDLLRGVLAGFDDDDQVRVEGVTTEAVILLTDATTANTTPAQTAEFFRGVLVFLNIDSLGGTSPSINATIQRQDPSSGNWEDTLSTGDLTTAGIHSIEIHPSIANVGGNTKSALLGREWRVDVTVDTSDGDETYQYDLSYVHVQ